MTELRARVLFMVRVAADRTTDFLRAYEMVRHEVSAVPGHLVDQICRSAADPEQWLVTSEWSTLADFEAWERSPGHQELVRPMRECFTDARSLRFLVHAQTPEPETVG
jgi:heme-degrading monooxygenase HmoA